MLVIYHYKHLENIPLETSVIDLFSAQICNWDMPWKDRLLCLFFETLIGTIQMRSQETISKMVDQYVRDDDGGYQLATHMISWVCFFRFFSFVCLFICRTCVDAYVTRNMCRSQRITWWDSGLPFHHLDSGVEHKLSGLVARGLTCWAMHSSEDTSP